MNKPGTAPSFDSPSDRGSRNTSALMLLIRKVALEAWSLFPGHRRDTSDTVTEPGGGRGGAVWRGGEPGVLLFDTTNIKVLAGLLR